MRRPTSHVLLITSLIATLTAVSGAAFYMVFDEVAYRIADDSFEKIERQRPLMASVKE